MLRCNSQLILEEMFFFFNRASYEETLFYIFDLFRRVQSPIIGTDTLYMEDLSKVRSYQGPLLDRNR